MIHALSIILEFMYYTVYRSLTTSARLGNFHFPHAKRLPLVARLELEHGDVVVTMGCLNTKAGNAGKKSRADANGTRDPPVAGEFSNIAQGQNDALGMSTRQVFSIKQSWKGIKRKMEETGVDMFVRLFRTNADLKKMFHKFKDISTEDQLRSNEALEYHATLVMGTLDDAIIHIDNYEYVKKVLYQTGAFHLKFPGFKPEIFYSIKEPFLDAVKVTLGDRYTDNMQNIYSIAITFIIKLMVDGCTEAMTISEHVGAK